MNCLNRAFLLSITLSVFHATNAQDPTLISRKSPIAAPINLETAFFPFARSVRSATLVCEKHRNANFYIFKIYSFGRVLEKEYTNRPTCYVNATGLEPSTLYNATVTGVIRRITGTTTLDILTAESQPYQFQTGEECKGGSVYTDCSGHCYSSCDNPDPICPRICTPGCNCVKPMVFIWHDSQCIPAPLCPPRRAIVKKPRNLKIFQLQSAGSILISWDEVSNTKHYTVKVRRNSNRRELIRDVTVKVPQTSLLIRGLTPNEEYIFIVGAIQRTPKGVGPGAPGVVGRSFPAPSDVTITDVTDDGFTVNWGYNRNARRYAIVIYLDDRESVIYSNDKLSSGRVVIDSLAPGSLYFVGVAAASYGGDLGGLSDVIGVRTTGVKDPTFDYYGSSVTGIFHPPPTTTSTPPTTTAEQTECLKRYQSVRQFYGNRPNATDGPAYPLCDSDGLFVTTKCTPGGPCYCLDPQTGAKKRWSDYGGDFATIPLSCDHFGTFPALLNPMTSLVRATEVTVEWSRVPQAFGYILIVTSQGQPSFTRTVVKTISDTIKNLNPATTYGITMYAISQNGWTSPTTSIQVTTAFVDAATGLRITSQTVDSVTVQWVASPSASSYRVELMQGGSVIETVETIELTATLTGASSGTYEVQLRALATMTNPVTGADDVHVSDAIGKKFSAFCSLPDLDILVSFDLSVQAGYKNQNAFKLMIADMLEKLPPIENGTRVAGVKYFDRTAQLFSFNNYRFTRNLLGAVRYVRYLGSQVKRAAMAKFIYEKFNFKGTFAGSRVTRPGALPVVIIHVGKAARNRSPWRNYYNLLASTTNVITVGVRGESSAEDMSQLASKPELQVWAQNSENLRSISNELIAKICEIETSKAKTG